MRYFDRVLTGSATVSGTGDVTWTVATAQYALPPSGVDTYTSYTILDTDGAAWETGHADISEAAGTYTLSRTGSQTVMASSNAGAAVSFSTATTHTLMLTPDASHIEATAPIGARVDLLTNLNSQVNTLLIPWPHEAFDDADFFDAGGDTTRLTVPSGKGITRVTIDAGLRLSNFDSAVAYTVTILRDGDIVAYFTGESNSSAAPAVTLSTGAIQTLDGTYFQLQLVCTEASYTVSFNGSFMAIKAVMRPEY